MTPYPSLAAIGAAAGSAIGRHLETTFRDMVRGENVTSEVAFLRLISGEPHPLGNMALLSAPVDSASARAAVEPLVASGMPSAVLFPGLEVPLPSMRTFPNVASNRTARCRRWVSILRA